MSNAQQTGSVVGQSDKTSDLVQASLDTVYASLGTSPKGLGASQAAQRIETCGRNELL